MENETKSAEQNNQGVTRAAGIVSVAVMGSRILGLARESGDRILFSVQPQWRRFLLGVSHSKLPARPVWRRHLE